MAQRNFSSVVSSTPTRPSTKPNQWEQYLLSMIQELQTQNKYLQETLTQAQEEVKTLRTDLLSSNTTIQEVMSKTGESVSEPHPKVVETIIAEIKERDEQDYVKREIRVGGLPDDWQTQEVLDEIEQQRAEEGYCSLTESELLERRVKKAIPSIDIGEPSMVEIKGPHVVLRYLYLKDKIAVMKQARALKGTKLWVADELTPLQLKSKKVELAKVHEARRQGKWAVYRFGKALIEDFKTPKTQEKTPS